MNARELWAQYEGKLNALSQRERIMVFCAALVVAAYAAYAMAVEPPQRRQRALENQMEQQREELAALQAQRAGASRGPGDPQTPARARREAVLKRIETADEALRNMRRELVPAQRVNELLHDMLKSGQGLELLSLRTLAVEPLLPDARKPPVAAKGGEPAPIKEFAPANVYKHGVELTLRGGFEDLYAYLARLERSEWHMFWSRARISTDRYPRLTMVVTIYTLSLDKAWLEV